MTVLGIIPARHASTRFPGKPLAVLAGKPMIRWVWERARAARTLNELIVATDDARIADCVTGFGGRVVLTSATHATGTDRLAEVALREGLGAEILVNVQGDEPLIDPASIDSCVEALRRDPGAAMATLCAPLASIAEYRDENVVKVVVAASGRALYFSRAPIPAARGGSGVPPAARRHVGLYAYRRPALLRLASLPRSPLEECESLEQLRALEDGMTIAVAEGAPAGPAVDVPGDVAAAEAELLRVMTTSH